MRELERRVVLSVIDRRWRDHLYEMDYLKDGIGLRAMAQRDPLVEYQREGFALYQQMMGSIREESVGFLFNLEVEVDRVATPPRPSRPSRLVASARAVHLPNDSATRRRTPTTRARSRCATSAASSSGPRRRRRSRPRRSRLQPRQDSSRSSGSSRRRVGAQRGAFGQRIDPNAPPPANRAERRAQERNK